MEKSNLFSYKDQLRRDGYTVIEPCEELENLIKEGNDEIDSIGKLFVEHFEGSSSLHTLQANKKGFYKAVRNCMCLYKIASSETIKSLSKEIGVSCPVLGPSSIRLDIKEESNHQFNWHQDAVSLLGSSKMFTYWVPFVDVSRKTGSIELLPGTHKHGIYKVAARDPEIADNNKSSNLLITEELETSRSLVIEAKAGSIVILDPFICHQSFYPQKTHQPRRTAIIRLDDLGDLKHLRLGFKNFSSGYNLINSPEYEAYYKEIIGY